MVKIVRVEPARKKWLSVLKAKCSAVQMIQYSFYSLFEKTSQKTFLHSCYLPKPPIKLDS